MSVDSRELRKEILILSGIISVALVITFNSNSLSGVLERVKSWYRTWFGGGRRIDSIYHLLPILDKNLKALFLVFSDVASAVNSLRGDGLEVGREAVEQVLTQEHLQNRMRQAQARVLGECGVDHEEFQAAIDRFAEDDQVRYYVDNLELMYKETLSGKFPQLPSDEPKPTQEQLLSIIQAIANKKANFLDNLEEKWEIAVEEAEAIHLEMTKFGCKSKFDSLVAYTGAMNFYRNDKNFAASRERIFSLHSRPVD